MSKRAIVRAAGRGIWADLRMRDIDGDSIRQICTRANEIDPRGLMIRRATVTGKLDLSGFEVPFPLRFEDCEFVDTPLFDGARLHELTALRCHLPCGLQANGLRVDRDVDLSGSRISGALTTTASTSKQSAIWLCEAEIGGRLLCVSTFIQPNGIRAIQADRLHVRGAVRMINGFVAHGEIRLLGATIDGSLDITSARIGRPGQLSLDIAEATIGGSFFLIEEEPGRTPLIHGRIDMGQTRIGGQMIVRSAEIGTIDAAPFAGPYAYRRRGGTAISAPRAVVNGDLSFEGTCHVRGGIDLSLGEFGHILFEQNCVLDAPDHVALDLANAELRSSLVMHDGARVAGTIRLESTAIKGHLTLRGVRLSRPQGRSLLSARAVRVDGDVELQRLEAVGGGLHLRGAELGNNLDIEAGTLTNPDGETLSLRHATVRGSLRLIDGFRSEGALVLARSVIDGRLDLRGGSFVCSRPDTDAVNAEAVVVRGGMYLGWTRVEPSVDFTDSQTTILADDTDTWPERFAIRGMTYERFGPLRQTSPSNWDGQQRARWLARQTPFEAGPYEQAARVFRLHGAVSAAEHLLISQRRHARRAAAQHSKGTIQWHLRASADRLYSIFGYGYRPGRAGWPLVLLLLAVYVLMLLPVGANTMRATDPRGNVYAPTGRLVTVTPVTDSPPSTVSSDRTVGDFAELAATAPKADPCGDGQVRCFNAFFYAIDTVVPLVSLGQRSTWHPDPHTPAGQLTIWFLDSATLLGWVLSSILAVSFARMARNI